MKKLTVRQLDVLRVVGAAVDEFEFRHEHARRVLTAIREQVRHLRERINRIDADVRDQQLRLRSVADVDAAVRLKDLEGQKKSIALQIASAEKAEIESSERLERMVLYSAPLRDTRDIVLRHAGLTCEEAGIPYGREVPRSVEADVVIGGVR